MHVVIFEDSQWKRFAPLALSRPVFSLFSGMGTLLEKQVRALAPSRLTLWVRPELTEFCRRRVIPRLRVATEVNMPLDGEKALLLSGRMLPLEKLAGPDQEAAIVDADEVVAAAWVARPGLSPADALEGGGRWMELLRLPRVAPPVGLVRRLWDLIGLNERALVADAEWMRRQATSRPAGPYHLVEPQNVLILSGVRIGPGVVLDGSRGPVVIDREAVLGANAVIQGPCYIGPQTQVMPLTLVRPGTSIDLLCKVGGEISNSIMFSYSNKSHEGYLGDSYVGKWANLGAGTSTSNLKNTYGQICVSTPQGPEPTGRQHLGAMIGDHVKTAIGTRLMAGSYVGFASMLAGSGIPGKFIPSFRFWTDRGMEAYRLEKAIDVMKVVFARRERVWDNVDESIVRYAAAVSPEVEGG